MVQFIDLEPGYADKIRTQLAMGAGQNIANVLGEKLGYQRDRQRIQEAMKGLEGMDAEGKSPFQLASALISATAGIPGSERYVGQLFPLLMQQMSSQKYGQIPPPGAPGGMEATSGMQGAIPGTQQGAAPETQKATPPMTQSQLPLQLPDPMVDPFAGATEGIDLGQGPIPKTYSEDQYRQVAQMYQKSGLDPSPAINLMQQQDQAARAKTQDLLTAAETTGRVAQIRRQAQEQFRGVLREQLPGLNETDLAVAETIAQKPQYQSIKNDKLRAEQVKKEFDQYQAAVRNFSKSSERQNTDQLLYNTQKKNLSTYAKKMVESGQRDYAEQLLKQNGWGPVETSEILNPLPEKVVSGFKNLPKLKDPLESVNISPENEKEFDAQLNNALKQRDKQLDAYKDYIKKNFETGKYDRMNVIKPGSSLLQLRDNFLKNGGQFQEFSSLMTDLVDKGDIVLDSYQAQEMPLLEKRPEESFGIGEILWRLNPFYTPRK